MPSPWTGVGPLAKDEISTRLFSPPILSLQTRPKMASFEDYDEFGNYIGADLESDEEEDQVPQHQTEPASAAPLEGFEDESIEPMAVMEVDGMLVPLIWHGLTNIVR